MEQHNNKSNEDLTEGLMAVGAGGTLIAAIMAFGVGVWAMLSGVGFLFRILVVLAPLAFIAKLCWNGIIVGTFATQSVTFLQAWGILVLLDIVKKVLFGSSTTNVNVNNSK